jgi:hypothetical protein
MATYECKCGIPLTGKNVCVNKLTGKRTCKHCGRHWKYVQESVNPHSSPTCINGHERTPGNSYIDKKGHRVCRVCRRERKRTTRAARAYNRLHVLKNHFTGEMIEHRLVWPTKEERERPEDSAK